MSNYDDFDEKAAQRINNAPYTPHHPVPTVQRYQGHKEERQAEADAQTPQKGTEGFLSGEDQGILQSTKNFLHLGEPTKNEAIDEDNPYMAANRNIGAPGTNEHGATNDHRENPAEETGDKQDQNEGNAHALRKDTSEAIDNTSDPRQKRRNMKHMARDHASREVTDPVTHLKVLIHDATDKELDSVPENEPPPGSMPQNLTRTTTDSKSQIRLDKETYQQQSQHSAMEKLFPPSSFDATREKITSVYKSTLTVGLCAITATTIIVLFGSFFLMQNTQRLLSSFALSSLLVVILSSVGGSIIWVLQGWMYNRIRSIWDDELWSAARTQENATTDSPMPESTQWLNSLLSSVWSLINPDLFTSLADTLEDVMQASLPKFVRMISVEDLGQGNESIRILGVRWLPTGAAAQSVSKDGKLRSDAENQETDRKVSGQGESDYSPDGGKDSSAAGEQKNDSDEQEPAEGMEAEEGDFVNLEVAFSYRASKSDGSIRTKSKNAHLYLAFYLPGKIRFRRF